MLTELNGGAVDGFLTLEKPLTANVALGGVIRPYANSVFDAIENVMEPSQTHRITDVGVGVVVPVWASDGVHDDDALGTGSGSLREFDGTGRLLDRDITIESTITASDYTDRPVELYYDVNPPEHTLYGEGFWSPFFISPVMADVNEESRAVTASRSQAGVRDFLLPASDSEIKPGALVQFVLRIGNLIAATVTDPADPRTVVPWSFSIGEITAQRSGVTILNNTINPEAGEKTILTFDLQAPSMVSIHVFSLAGDLVDTIQHGRLATGSYTFSWDGTNRAGDTVARGLYFIRVVASGIDEYRKVLVVK